MQYLIHANQDLLSYLRAIAELGTEVEMKYLGLVDIEYHL